MKVMIAGSRSIESIDISAYIPTNTDLIISGGAKGIDSIAEQYADRHSISKLILRPDWSKYGKAAPLVRNKLMVDLADLIIIVWDGRSNGTKYTLNYANKSKKPVKLITEET